MAESGNCPLTLRWAFGFSRETGVHNLCDENRSALFYVSAHTGVIYDLASKRQMLLQGHSNQISCTCASADRRWVATADAGPESMLVIWDSHRKHDLQETASILLVGFLSVALCLMCCRQHCTPVGAAYSGAPRRTIAMPHAGGVKVMDLSPDARYMVTLSEGETPQVLSIWDLHSQSDAPIHTAQVGTVEEPAEPQISVRFDPSDVHSIVTNGAALVVFWSWEGDELSYYAPLLGERDFKQQVGALCSSLFIPGTKQAVSVTADGDAVLWDSVHLDEVAFSERRATKLVKLHSGAILFVDTIGDLLVTGAADGHVRFFDFEFRVVAWFEDLDAGPVTRVSFAHQPGALKGDGTPALRCPDFVVGTANSLIISCEPSMFEELRPEDRRGTLLVQGQDAAVHGLAAHPSMPRFACTGHSGLLQLWDYQEKRLLLLRMFEKLLGHCLAFTPRDGRLLACGFTNGTLKLLDGSTLQEVASFKENRGTITEMAFSHDGAFLAAADAEQKVAVFNYQASFDDSRQKSWELLGRYKGHTGTICSLFFSDGPNANGFPRLFSAGEDRQLLEYDLARSSVQEGVQLRKSVRLEQSAMPTACMWLEAAGPAGEPCVAVANDGYKLRLVEANPMTIVQTFLGPTFGGPLMRMRAVPGAAEGGEEAAEETAEARRFVAYATAEKVVGIVALPFDGNPNKAMGLIAHPGEISALVPSFDGKWLITAGGNDLSIHLWQLEPAPMEEAIKAGGEGIAPFEAQLDGGKEGHFYKEMMDYFYYSQLRAQGEDTTEPRRITGKVPTSEIGNLMRALGYYPSEREIDELVQEANYTQQHAGAGVADGTFDFGLFVRLYVNHRPALGVSKEQIGDALKALGAGDDGVMERDKVLQLLQSHGEALSADDLAQCFRALLGTSDISKVCGRQLDSVAFAEGVLGFEDQ